MSNNFRDNNLKKNESNKMLEFLADPKILSEIGNVFSSIGSLFSDKRRRLTHQDWLNSMPGNGYWTSKIRNYLESRIHYDVDIKNVEPFSQVFIHENLYEISGGKWQNLSTALTSQEWNMVVVNGFYKMLDLEKQGKSPKHIFDTLDVTISDKISDEKGNLIGTDSPLANLFTGSFMPVFVIGIILIIILIFKK
jgi:hypothetical protein